MMSSLYVSYLIKCIKNGFFSFSNLREAVFSRTDIAMELVAPYHHYDIIAFGDIYVNL
jgi:hypothetical protein